MALPPFHVSHHHPRRDRMVLLVLLFAVGSCLILALIYRATIFAVLDRIAQFVTEAPVPGFLLCVCLLILTSFPPIPGYSTIIYLFGYIYGFPLGWFPAFIGALCGSMLSFHLSRYYLRDWALRKLSHYPKATALRKTIEKRGLKLIILIRLVPYPFNFCNVLLATTNITFQQFTLATAASLPKALLHIYVGASVSSFSDIGSHSSGGRIAILAVSLAIGLGLTLWLWIHVQNIVNQDNATDVEESLVAEDNSDMYHEGSASFMLANYPNPRVVSSPADHAPFNTSPDLIINTNQFNKIK